MTILDDVSTRRLYLNNWAILTAENEIKWHFGDLDKDKLQKTLDFVNSISKLGSEVWGQGIGTIRLRYPRPHPSQAREIMIVNLLDKYSIVISDPLVTTRLMSKIEFESDIIPHWLDEMRSILAGTASVIYSQFYSKEEIIDQKVADDLFKQAVTAVTYNEDVTVGEGQCSFSAMTIEELLFFHALLRELFKSYIAKTVPGDPWGIISSVTGTPVYLLHDSPVSGAMMSAFTSVIITYCRLLYGASPESLVFGGHAISRIDIISTEKNMFILNNPAKLLKQQKFISSWKRVPAEVIHDLAPQMKEYMLELSIAEQKENMKAMEFHRIVNRLTKMGAKRVKAYKLPPLGETTETSPSDG
ncbi:MAG: hypothetical protein ACFFD4_23225 [Candidatus Odinarchaeota archaeon]